MARQIDQFGDVAEILGGRTPCLVRQPCDLVDLARQVAADYQAMTDRHDIQVESTAPQFVGTWDGLRLARVLANLLSNAIKYSPESGEIAVTLTTDAALPEIAIINVRDHGIGIPARDLPLLFTPFHRGANVGSVSGTGLGLASVKLVVELHGGTISADSQEGVGTTMTISLPLLTQSPFAERQQIAAN
jgi:signal transduction histidine kinase